MIQNIQFKFLSNFSLYIWDNIYNYFLDGFVKSIIELWHCERNVVNVELSNMEGH